MKAGGNVRENLGVYILFSRYHLRTRSNLYLAGLFYNQKQSTLLGYPVFEQSNGQKYSPLSSRCLRERGAPNVSFQLQNHSTFALGLSSLH